MFYKVNMDVKDVGGIYKGKGWTCILLKFFISHSDTWR